MTGLGRRELLQVATATAALAATSPALAQGKSPTQADLLRFKPTGQLTILNFTDLHAQLVPLYFREPSANIGVGVLKILTISAIAAPVNYFQYEEVAIVILILVVLAIVLFYLSKRKKKANTGGTAAGPAST